MKKTNCKLIFMLTMAMLFLFSCKKNASNVENDETNEASIRSKVARLGFDTSNMVMKGDTIIVEGDILLTKSNLIKTSPRHASTVDLSTTAFPINYTKQRNLKYYISSTVSSWESAIVEAIFQYNGFGNFNLHFDRTTNINEADLRFSDDGNLAGTTVFAYAEFPANGNIGAAVKINLNVSLVEEKKVFIIVHEVGHAIGLRHTNWRGDSEPEFDNSSGVSVGAYLIPGTLNSSSNPDPGSVFNSGKNISGAPNWSGFSLMDRTALTNLYPVYSAQPIQFNITPNGNSPVFVGQKINASVSMPWREGGLTYQWFSQGVTITKNNGHSIEAVITDVSSAGVACWITNIHGEVKSVSKSYGPNEID